MTQPSKPEDSKQTPGSAEGEVDAAEQSRPSEGQRTPGKAEGEDEKKD